MSARSALHPSSSRDMAIQTIWRLLGHGSSSPNAEQIFDTHSWPSDISVYQVHGYRNGGSPTSLSQLTWKSGTIRVQGLGEPKGGRRQSGHAQRYNFAY